MSSDELAILRRATAQIESLGHVACGWAFDAGMREAEQATMRAFFYSTIDQMHEREAEAKREADAAVAAERERCAKVEAELRAALADALKGRDYACETPLAGCDCPGCSLARDESGAPAPRKW